MDSRNALLETDLLGVPSVDSCNHEKHFSDTLSSKVLEFKKRILITTKYHIYYTTCSSPCYPALKHPSSNLG
ncbi:hypothetical protein VTK26DRAFT_5571 [Humicola hyalothermophila]